MSDTKKTLKKLKHKCKQCKREYMPLDVNTGFCSTACQQKIGKAKPKKRAKPKMKDKKVKPILPGTFRTVYEVEYSDYDNYIKEVYGIDSDVVLENEWSNDSNHSVTVTGKEKDVDIEDKEKIRKGERPSWRHPGVFLECLCEDGYIQPGDYIINVCW